MAAYKSVIGEKIAAAKTDFVKDLSAMPHEALEASPGGQARAPYDFTYEVAMVNDRMASFIRGEKPGPWPFEGWAVAPAEYRNQAMAISEIERSADGLLAAWSALDESEVDREITFTNGTTGDALGLVLLCISHMGYHDAQLNYVQSIGGDLAVHW